MNAVSFPIAGRVWPFSFAQGNTNGDRSKGSTTARTGEWRGLSRRQVPRREISLANPSTDSIPDQSWICHRASVFLEDLFGRHPRFMARSDGFVIYVKKLSPLGERHFPVLVGKRYVASPVVRLFLCGGPSTIFRTVVTLVVYSIYRMIRRSLTHVGKEVSESKPSVADFDSSSAVPGIGAHVGLLAPGLHMRPDLISSSFTSAVEGSLASAGRALPAPQPRCDHVDDTATVATTNPLSGSFEAPDRNQLSESLAGSYWGFHIANITHREVIL